MAVDNWSKRQTVLRGYSGIAVSGEQHVQIPDIELAETTDTALSVTPISLTGIVYPGMAAQADTALPVTAGKPILYDVGIAAETDTAPVLSGGTVATLDRPYFLATMGFDTDVLYSTIGSLVWVGDTYLSAGMEITGLPNNPTVTIFNENTTIGQLVLAQGTTGRTIKIYQGDQDDVGHPTPVLVFDGEMGKATITDRVVIACKRRKPSRTPRHFVVPPVFNHIPPSGTRFETPKEIIILE